MRWRPVHVARHKCTHCAPGFRKRHDICPCDHLRHRLRQKRGLLHRGSVAARCSRIWRRRRRRPGSSSCRCCCRAAGRRLLRSRAFPCSCARACSFRLTLLALQGPLVRRPGSGHTHLPQRLHLQPRRVELSKGTSKRTRQTQDAKLFLLCWAVLGCCCGCRLVAVAAPQRYSLLSSLPLPPAQATLSSSLYCIGFGLVWAGIYSLPL